MESRDMDILVGFLLFLLAFSVAALYVVPSFAFLIVWFAFAGTAAVPLVAAIVTFPILILTFYIAHRASLKAIVPEAE